MAKSIEPLLRRLARKYNLDERAVIAVAMGEGGLYPGWHVGDVAGGGSYGPFQLYAQGALPRRFRGKPALANAWAWSPQGIEYALRQMVKVGAAGLRGPEAINVIIRRFERPANPDRSVALAVSRYYKIPPSGPTDYSYEGGEVSETTVPSPRPGKVVLPRQEKNLAPKPDIGALRSRVLLSLMAERASGALRRPQTLAALIDLFRARGGRLGAQ